MGESPHNGARASLRRLRLIGLHTLGEALHMRLTLLLGLVGAGLVFAALGLREFNFGATELKFIGDFGLGALGFIGMLVAALATAQLFFNDLANGAVCCILTRPVRRWEYIWAKFAGVAALLALFTAALGALVAVLLVRRGAQLGVAPFVVPAFLCACAVQWLKMTLVAALTLLACSFASSALFASCAGLLLALIAHLRQFVNGSGPLAWLRFWPNLALFDAETLLASDQSLPGAGLAGLAAYWAANVLFLGIFASHVFQRREF